MTDTDRLAFYVPSLTVGGAERVTVSVTNGLARRGYDVDLLVSYCEGPFLEEVSDEVNLVDLETRHVPGLGIGAAVPRLVTYLRSESPAALFSQMTYANDVCLFAHRLSGSTARTFPTVHNTLGMDDAPKERFVQWLSGRLSPQVDQFVAVSEGVARSIVEHTGVPEDKVTVLHNPIPVDEVSARARDPVDHEWIRDADIEVVLGVGRLERQKNFQLFIEAFDQIHRERPQTRAILVGEGSKRKELEALVEERDLSSVVDFAGYVDNPYGYMGGASVLVMSSIHEGLPTVLIEALACGCPVVSTDCPSGPREILQDGTLCPLVPVGDGKALADAVCETLADPPSSETLVERASDFAPEAVIDDYAAFIRGHLGIEPMEPPVQEI